MNVWACIALGMRRLHVVRQVRGTGHRLLSEIRANVPIAASEDLIYDREFVDKCRYASAIVIIGHDPDRPGRTRVTTYSKETVGPNVFREPLGRRDLADCLRVHADAIEAGEV